MTRHHAIRLVALIVTLAALPAFAHDSYRIVGVVTKRQDTAISVRSRDGKTTAIRMSKYTDVTRNTKKVDAAEVKVGSSVVVDALGDSEEDLEALEVQLVPDLEAPKK
jgi:hypothetical protein